MAKISLPYSIINGDPVDAGPVESNYQTIENHANQELIERGGTVAMTAQLKLVGNPVAALDAAPKQYVDQVVPIGGILMYGGTVAPAGGVWLLCDGSEYQEATYPALAAIIGAAAGRFNVPALVNRLPVGGGGTYAHKTTGGSADAIVPIHAHTMAHSHVADATNTDHLHTVNGHSHGVGSVAVSLQGAHTHGGDAGPLVQALQSGINVSRDVGPTAFWGGWSGTTVAGDHGHTLSGFTDNTAPGTGWQDRSAAHGHGIQAFNGATSNAGEALAGKNMPPYFALAFIIRAI